jgi:hypothetical protein
VHGLLDPLLQLLDLLPGTVPMRGGHAAIVTAVQA